MMRQFQTFMIAGTAMILASCGAAGEHATCVDAQSATAYGIAWQDDLAAARRDGTVSIEQVVDAQGRIYSELGMVRDERWSDYCNLLDEVRADTGF